MELLRKELENAKDDRNRYQQREIDAKADVHTLKMRFEELENRRKLEFEEYRTSRSSLERELTVFRDKLQLAEAMHKKSDDQKVIQLAQLEETKHTLESELHRISLTESYVGIRFSLYLLLIRTMYTDHNEINT